MRKIVNFILAFGILQIRHMVLLLGLPLMHRVKTKHLDICVFPEKRIESMWTRASSQILISMPSEYCEFEHACLTAENVFSFKKQYGCIVGMFAGTKER